MPEILDLLCVAFEDRPRTNNRNDREADLGSTQGRLFFFFKTLLILRAYRKGKKFPGDIVVISVSLKVFGKRLDLIFCLASVPSFISIPSSYY